MKTSLQRLNHQKRGSLIVTAAVSSAVVALLIGGILTYIGNEYVYNLRGHRWAEALNLAEAGVEMGFAEFNNYYLNGTNGFSSTRGWSGSGGSYYRYVPSFTNAHGEVEGLVYAYVNNVGSSSPYLFAYGSCATTPRGPRVYRAVESRITRNPYFPAAMVAKDTLDLNGNNIYTDSFDSTDPTKSTSYLYDPNERQPNGDIASNSTIENSINIGNADIYGTASVGPGGTVEMGANGSIGDTFVESDRATTVEDAEAEGWIRNDFQVDIPDVTLPSGVTWINYPTGQINNASPTINSGDWRVSSVDLSSTKVLTIDGNVKMYVTGDFRITGSAQITIAPNSSLTVYIAGSANIGGNGMVNQTGQAVNNQLYGLPTCTSWSLNGNGYWIGTVYAPQADVTLNGGGSTGDMSGSIVANNITLTGQTQFHYDEMLGEEGPVSGFNIVSWKSYRWTGSDWAAD